MEYSLGLVFLDSCDFIGDLTGALGRVLEILCALRLICTYTTNLFGYEFLKISNLLIFLILYIASKVP